MHNHESSSLIRIHAMSTRIVPYRPMMKDVSGAPKRALLFLLLNPGNLLYKYHVSDSVNNATNVIFHLNP